MKTLVTMTTHSKLLLRQRDSLGEAVTWHKKHSTFLARELKKTYAIIGKVADKNQKWRTQIKTLGKKPIS